MALSSPYPSITQTRRVISDTLLRVVEDHRKAVGDRLRDLRKARGMSQMDAATAVGVQLKTWGDWERGKRDPYDQNWRKIGETFEVDPAMIRGTPPAPLGLGAREDQVEDVRDEFRGKVDQIIARQGEIFDRLDVADADRAAIQALLREQSQLLAQQSDLLDRLRNVMAVLPAIDQLVTGRDAAAEIPELPPAAEEGPPSGEERRRGDRRRSG